MPRLVSCPQDQGVTYGYLSPIACVLHRTYGGWAGDYSVIKSNGLAHFLIGKESGQWVQFADTTQVQYHCNGANFKAVGIELTGTNDDALTDWQEQRLGEVLEFLHAEHGIPLVYLDPNSVPPASVHVNDGNFRGVISHVSVMTDDGSAQHSDEVSAPAVSAAVDSGDDDMAQVPQDEWNQVRDFVLKMRDGDDTYGVPKLLPTLAEINKKLGNLAPQFGIDDVLSTVAKIRAKLGA